MREASLTTAEKTSSERPAKSADRNFTPSGSTARQHTSGIGQCAALDKFRLLPRPLVGRSHSVPPLLRRPGSSIVPVTNFRLEILHEDTSEPSGRRFRLDLCVWI